MADITLIDQKKLISFFGSNENNWFVTHKELNILFDQYKINKYNVDPDLVSEEVGSKKDRISAFWNKWPNLIVSKFLMELIYLANQEIDTKNNEWIFELEECKKIAESLQHNAEKNKEIKLANPYFENQRELILADLNKAKIVIWVCMYLFTDYKIASKILEKHREGLSVEIILQDHELNQRKNLNDNYWRKLESVLWWYPKTDGGINHHKFCIIDGQIVWQGSFNFTFSAATKNQEDYTRDTNIETIYKFSDQFKKLKKYINQEKRVRSDIEPDFPF